MSDNVYTKAMESGTEKRQSQIYVRLKNTFLLRLLPLSQGIVPFIRHQLINRPIFTNPTQLMK